MTANINPTIEMQLADLTRWPGGSPQLWGAALANCGSDEKEADASWFSRAARIALRPRWIACAAVLVLLVSAIIVNSTDSARREPPNIFRLPSLTPSQFICPSTTDASTSCGEDYLVFGKRPQPTDGDMPLSTAMGRAAASSPPHDVSLDADDVASGTMARQIVRTATIELRVQDVRSVFMKIGMIPSAARGEFVQDSSLNGTAQYLRGNIKLRVEADRLHEVLNQLREFGEVTSEQVKGEDVTGQVVDLDARLRNERRIEEELLALLSNREDAPLKDILEVRSKLGDVRREIESLTAQRSQLSHLVSLATVLVLLQPADAPAISHDSNWSYFKRACTRSWQSGVEFLANTLATMVAIVIGGLFWWCVLLVVVWLVIRRHDRKAQREA